MIETSDKTNIKPGCMFSSFPEATQVGVQRTEGNGPKVHEMKPHAGGCIVGSVEIVCRGINEPESQSGSPREMGNRRKHTSLTSRSGVQNVGTRSQFGKSTKAPLSIDPGISTKQY